MSVRQSQFTLHKHASLFHFIVPYDDVDYYKYKLPSQLVELYDFDDDSVGGYDFEDDSVGNSNDGAAAGSGSGDVIPPIASGTEHSNVDTEDDGAEERVMHVFHPTATEFVNNISGSDVVHVSVITRNGSGKLYCTVVITYLFCQTLTIALCLDVNVPSFRYVHIDGLTVKMETCDSPLPGVYPFFGENLFQHVYLADLQVKYVELLYCIEMIYAKFDVWSTERVFAKTSSLSFAALQDHAHKSLMILTASTDKQVKEHLEKYVSKDSPLLESIRATAALFEQRVITAMLTGRCYIE